MYECILLLAGDFVFDDTVAIVANKDVVPGGTSLVPHRHHHTLMSLTAMRRLCPSLSLLHP